MKQRKVVILGAMPQEIAAYETQIKEGRWNGIETYVALTGVGKPMAAATTQRMIDLHSPDAIIFTGVAGGLESAINVGDIGVVTRAIDADLDVRSWDSSYQRGEVPFSRERVYHSEDMLVRLAMGAPCDRRRFDSYVATGSSFLDAEGKQNFLREVAPDLADDQGRLPNTYEMEGSAVLQIAKANGIPALALRSISDTTTGDSAADFNAFIENAVNDYVGIVGYVLENF